MDGGDGLVAKSCPTLCNPMDCSPRSSSVHGILQARILEWVAISFSRGIFPEIPWPRNRTRVFCIAARFFTNWATTEAILYIHIYIYNPLFFEFPSHLGHHKALNTVPCVCSHQLPINTHMWNLQKWYCTVQSLSCVQLCDPMDCSTPDFPVHHQLLELTQTHVHRDNDAIQPSLPLLSPSPPAFNLSQHQGLFQWVSSLHQVAKGLELQLLSNEYSGLIYFRMDWLDLLAVQETLKSSPTSKFKSFNSSALSFLLWSHSHIHPWLLENHSFD